jgi:hypothetical protein
VIPQITVVPTPEGLLSAARQLAVLDLANENRKRAQECRQFWWRFWRPVRAVSDPAGYLEAMTRYHFTSLQLQIIGDSRISELGITDGKTRSYEELAGIPVEIIVCGEIDQAALSEMKYDSTPPGNSP